MRVFEITATTFANDKAPPVVITRRYSARNAGMAFLLWGSDPKNAGFGGFFVTSLQLVEGKPPASLNEQDPDYRH